MFFYKVVLVNSSSQATPSKTMIENDKENAQPKVEKTKQKKGISHNN